MNSLEDKIQIRLFFLGERSFAKLVTIFREMSRLACNDVALGGEAPHKVANGL